VIGIERGTGTKNLDTDGDAWRRHREDIAARRPFNGFVHEVLVGDITHHLSISGRPVFDTDGVFTGYRGTGVDITARIEAERELTMSEERFHAAFHTNPEITLIADADTSRIVDTNDAFAALFGAREEVIGKTTREIGLWANVSDYRKARRLVVAEGSLRGFETQWNRAKGGVAEIVLSAELMEMGGETVILSVANDVTERAAAEAEVCLSEARLAEAQRIAGVGSWEAEVHPETHALRNRTYSAHLCELLAVPPDEPVSTALFLRRVHANDRKAVRRALKAAMDGGPRYDVDYRIVRPDGSERILHAQAKVTFDSAGRSHPAARHRPGHYQTKDARKRTTRGETPSRDRQPGEISVPRQHDPRVPDAVERRDRLLPDLGGRICRHTDRPPARIHSGHHHIRQPLAPPDRRHLGLGEDRSWQAFHRRQHTHP
jgi:PAS domain S-box-containing protein